MEPGLFMLAQKDMMSSLVTAKGLIPVSTGTSQ